MTVIFFKPKSDRATEAVAMIEPIESALRCLRKEIGDLEWTGGDARPLQALVEDLLAAQARGERWHITF